MKLSNLLVYENRCTLIRDSEFEYFAQCIINLGIKTFTFIDDEKYLNSIKRNNSISGVICSPALSDKIPERMGVIVSDEPRYDFFRLYNLYMAEKCVNIPDTVIGEKFSCGKNVSISEKGVIIGNNVRIGDNVVIKENTTIRDDVTILSGCVLGEEGFEVKRKADNSLYCVKHYGNICIGRSTVLKSMVSMHRAVFDWDTTSIGQNCVVDSMTHLAHGVKVHDKVLIGSNASLCGNCEILDAAYLGPNVCICNRIVVGKGSKVSIGSVVTKNVPDGEVVTGNFAINHEKWMRFIKEIAN